MAIEKARAQAHEKARETGHSTVTRRNTCAASRQVRSQTAVPCQLEPCHLLPDAVGTGRPTTVGRSPLTPSCKGGNAGRREILETPPGANANQTDTKQATTENLRIDQNRAGDNRHPPQQFQIMERYSTTSHSAGASSWCHLRSSRGGLYEGHELKSMYSTFLMSSSTMASWSNVSHAS